MGKRFGIGALAVAALIAAGPASAQLGAKPAVGVSIGVQSAVLQDGGDYGYVPDQGQGWEFWSWAAFGAITVGATAVALDQASDPNSP